MDQTIDLEVLEKQQKDYYYGLAQSLSRISVCQEVLEFLWQNALKAGSDSLSLLEDESSSLGDRLRAEAAKEVWYDLHELVRVHYKQLDSERQSFSEQLFRVNIELDKAHPVNVEPLSNYGTNSSDKAVFDFSENYMAKNSNFLELIGLPQEYWQSFRIHQKDDKIDVYYGGNGEADGPGHGHIVCNFQGQVVFHRPVGEGRHKSVQKEAKAKLDPSNLTGSRKKSKTDKATRKAEKRKAYRAEQDYEDYVRRYYC